MTYWEEPGTRSGKLLLKSTLNSQGLPLFSHRVDFVGFTSVNCCSASERMVAGVLVVLGWQDDTLGV